MTTAEDGTVSLEVAAAEDGAARGWVLRLHLRPGQRVACAHVDDTEVEVAHIAPTDNDAGATRFFPFGGKDAAPAPAAGHIAQIVLPSSAHARTAVVHLA